MLRRSRLAALTVATVALGPFTTQASEKKTSGGLSYTPLPTLTAPLLAGGRRGVLTVEAGTDTPDKALKARVDLLGPRLRDAYASVLATFAAALPAGAPPDVDLLAQRLQAATDRVVGRPGCRFLIGTVMAE